MATWRPVNPNDSSCQTEPSEWEEGLTELMVLKVPKHSACASRRIPRACIISCVSVSTAFHVTRFG